MKPQLANLIKNSTKLALVILVSVLEVRVHAMPTEYPKNCLESEESCAIQNEKNAQFINTQAASISLGEGASLNRKSDSEFQLIRGTFKVYAKSDVKLLTLFGEMTLTEGDVLVEVKDQVVNFTNLSADLKYSPRGESQNYNLPVGFSMYLSRITKTGVAEAGMPRPAEIEPLIKIWSRLYSRQQKSQFISDLKEFMVSWRAAIQFVGPWYLDTVQRSIASQEAEDARRARLKAEQDRENNKYREMFRKRILDP
jgi:hypothetical protein